MPSQTLVKRYIKKRETRVYRKMNLKRDFEYENEYNIIYVAVLSRHALFGFWAGGGVPASHPQTPPELCFCFA